MMIDYCNAMQWICCEESRWKKMMIDYYCNAMQWIGGGDRRQQPSLHTGARIHTGPIRNTC